MRRTLGSFLTLALIASALVVVGVAAPAAACSCIATTDTAAFDGSDAVFTGRMVERTEVRPDVGFMHAVVTFEAIKVFKGHVAKSQEVVTGLGGGDCGLPFEERASYVVFAQLDSALGLDTPMGPGQLSASICGGTRPSNSGPLDVEGARSRRPRAKPADVIASGLVRIDSARLGSSPDELTVGFVGAPKVPRSDPCWEGYRARVVTYGNDVHVTLRRLRDATPEENVGCNDIGAQRTLRVKLRDPLGDRSVFDGSSGEPVTLTTS